MKFLITTLAVVLATSSAFAARRSLISDLDSLGSNKGIAERAKAIDADNRIRVVQNRTVDRTMRLEFGVNYGTLAGGDSYIDTNQLGFSADFHIVPMISIGARHFNAYNSLTPEGERVLEDAKANGDSHVSRSVDMPESSTMGTITLYPLYGKLNFFNIGISQFDVYMIGGYGQMKTRNTTSDTWTAGGGVGIWWSQHFNSRLEARYQNYTDQISSGNRDVGTTVFTFGIGFMI